MGCNTLRFHAYKNEFREAFLQIGPMDCIGSIEDVKHLRSAGMLVLTSLINAAREADRAIKSHTGMHHFSTTRRRKGRRGNGNDGNGGEDVSLVMVGRKQYERD